MFTISEVKRDARAAIKDALSAEYSLFFDIYRGELCVCTYYRAAVPAGL